MPVPRTRAIITDLGVEVRQGGESARIALAYHTSMRPLRWEDICRIGDIEKICERWAYGWSALAENTVGYQEGVVDKEKSPLPAFIRRSSTSASVDLAVGRNRRWRYTVVEKDFRKIELRLIKWLWEWCWTCIIMLVQCIALRSILREGIGFFEVVGDGQTISCCEVRKILSWCGYSGNRLRFYPPCAASINATLGVLLLFPRNSAFAFEKAALHFFFWLHIFYEDCRKVTYILVKAALLRGY